MLSNTLSIIEMTIQRKMNKNIDSIALTNFFKIYRKNMWIYPGVLKRKFSLSIPEIYDFLSELEKQGILQSYYELYCHKLPKNLWGQYVCLMSYQKLLNVNSAIANSPQ